MEYIFGAPVNSYDIDGIVLEECSAALSVHKPMFVGTTPFTVSCSVLRNGNRDIAPPGVDRSAADLYALERVSRGRVPWSCRAAVGL